MEGLRWKPDLFIAPSADFRGFHAWVTYAGSENDSQQKFWRNLAEMIDVRDVFPDIVTVSIVAGGELEKKFRNAQLHMFHKYYEVEESGIHQDALKSYLDDLGRSGLNAGQRLERASELVAEDTSFSALIDSVGASLQLAWIPNSIHASFWNPVEGIAIRPEDVGITYFRRGIEKKRPYFQGGNRASGRQSKASGD